MNIRFDIEVIKERAKQVKRYDLQLKRLQSVGVLTDCIEHAVNGSITNIQDKATSSLVIYGEPQSGKTEMMICLTAKLLDEGYKRIIHLMNDSVDLLSQNLRRFKTSGLAPATKNSSEITQILNLDALKNQELVIFCKKNARDLEKLIERITSLGSVVVIDDEADYATPNSKINQQAQTTIYRLVRTLIGNEGRYIGVTATPARLDLNNTFDTVPEKWVKFPPHANYTGQNTFFPIDHKIKYRLNLLPNEVSTASDAQRAVLRFLVTSAYLNVFVDPKERNYSMLVHTSGKKQDHLIDRKNVEDALYSLINQSSNEFPTLVASLYNIAEELYPNVDTSRIAEYVIRNISRAVLTVLNSERDRSSAGESATDPSSPFTIIIGGNIVSRGVTFPNLLSMFFTRNVRSKLQQDTYIQRARMFGARGEYLQHFELTIPTNLYADWHRCFVFHRLALNTIGITGSPVWIGDGRISVAAATSVNRATVALDKGEMSFGIFEYTPHLEHIIHGNQRSVETLERLRNEIGDEALPRFLIEYVETTLKTGTGSLAIHSTSSIAGYNDSSVDQERIFRAKGFIGKSQLEQNKFPDAVHHIKIFINDQKKGKVFYKFRGSLQFIQNMKRISEQSTTLSLPF